MLLVLGVFWLSGCELFGPSFGVNLHINFRPVPRIYWDIFHDTDDDSITTDYETYADTLIARGYEIVEKGVTITAGSLSGFHILVIVEPEIALSANEQAAIQDWIAEGGHGLLVFGEQSGHFDMASVNALLSAYEIAIATNLGTQDVDDFAPVGISQGISEISYVLGADLSVGVSSDEVAWTNLNETVVATHEAFGSRIVVIGDSSFVDHINVNDKDNLDYGINMMDWLAAVRD